MKVYNFAITSLAHGHIWPYFPAVAKLPNARIAAVADENKDRLVRAVQRWGIKNYYSDYTELLKRHPEIDAVIPGSENVKHKEQVLAAAEAGKHVMSMKVLSMDLKECDEIIKACEKAGVKLQVELELHYNPPGIMTKKAIEEGRVGKVKAIMSSNITGCPVRSLPWQGDPILSYGKAVPLMPGDPRFRGGAITDHPHIMDYVRWLTGSDFKTVYAEVGGNVRDWLKVEDNAVILGELENGAKVSMDPSWAREFGWPKGVGVEFRVVGEEGVIEADLFGENLYTSSDPENRLGTFNWMFPEWDGVVGSFVKCLAEDTKPTVTGLDGRKAVEVMVAAYESISSGRPVRLPL